MKIVDGVHVGWPLHKGPHDELVMELAAFAREIPGCTPYVNALGRLGDGGRRGGYRLVDLRIRRGDACVIVEAKTDLSYPYLIRRAVAQVKEYGSFISAPAALVVVAREVGARVVDGVHVLDVPTVKLLFNSFLPSAEVAA